MTKFAFDPSLCTACHACEVACAMWHDMPSGKGGFRLVAEERDGAFPSAKRQFRTEIRHGCDLCKTSGGNPHCASTCPTGALTYK